ncbi:MAG TPA: HEAT repeat domain-containing protein [Elusimicrobiota bacterium]|nr:HEAT repeat domain-containing protein [Elusimicrobiota bacterium]
MRHSPIWTAGLVILPATLLGASGLPKVTVQTLIKLLQDTSVEVRTAAAQALTEVPDAAAVKPLETALVASSDANEQQALVAALEAVNDKSTAKRLSEGLSNPQFTWGAGAKAKAVEVVGKIGDRKMIKWLTDLSASEQEPAVRAAAARALGQIGAPPKKDDKK